MTDNEPRIRAQIRSLAGVVLAGCLLAGPVQAAPVLEFLGSYDFQAQEGVDHLHGSAVFDDEYLAVASVTGVAMVSRAEIESGVPVDRHHGKYTISPLEPSNLDGAPPPPDIFYRPKFFKAVSAFDHLYVTTRFDGLFIFRPAWNGLSWNVNEVGRHLRPREFTEGVLVRGRRLFLAHHGDGIEVMSLGDPSSPRTIATLGDPLVDAWEIATSDGRRIWVADGAGGVKLVRLRAGALEVLAGDTLETSPGAVFDVAVRESRVLAAVGGQGLAVYDAATAARLSVTRVPGVCVDLEPMAASLWAAACRSWLHVVTILPDGTVDIVASVQLQRRVKPGVSLTTRLGQQVSVAGNRLYVSAWDHVDAFAYLPDDPDAAPDIRLSGQRVQFGSAAAVQTVQVTNGGQGTLQIDGVTCDIPGIVCQLDAQALPPGAAADLTVSYNGLPADVAGRIDIRSNDPDEPVAGILVFADLSGIVDPGETAPPFSGMVLRRDYDTGRLELSNLSLGEFAARGEVVHFAVVGSWCPACPHAFSAMIPDVATRLPGGSAFFLVDQGEPIALVAHILEKLYLPVDVLLDVDESIGGDLYWQPEVGFPFSRSYNVDTNGIATHVFTGYDPAAIIEALEDLTGPGQ